MDNKNNILLLYYTGSNLSHNKRVTTYNDQTYQKLKSTLPYTNNAVNHLHAWVLFFQALHDIGKLDVRFQLKNNPKIIETWAENTLNNPKELKSEINDYNYRQSGFDWAFRIGEYYEWSHDIDLDNEENADNWMYWLWASVQQTTQTPHMSADFLPPKNKFAAAQDKKARQLLIDIAEAVFLYPVGLSITSPVPVCNSDTQYELAKLYMDMSDGR